MKRFKTYILNENPQSIYDKYFDDIEWVDYVRLVRLDPTSKIKKGEIKKVGKYVKFLKKWSHMFTTWSDDMLDGFKYQMSVYDEFSKQKFFEIPPFEKFKDFRDLQVKLGELASIEFMNPVMDFKPKGFDYVRQITTYEGAMFFTPKKECNWCTAYDNDSYWNRYMNNRQGNIYVLYKKQRPYIQIYFTDDMVFREIQKRRSSDELNLRIFMNDHEDIKKWIEKKHNVEFVDDTINLYGREFAFKIIGDFLLFDGDVDLTHTGIKSMSEFVEEFPDGITKYRIEGNLLLTDTKLEDVEGFPEQVEKDILYPYDSGIKYYQIEDDTIVKGNIKCMVNMREELRDAIKGEYNEIQDKIMEWIQIRDEKVNAFHAYILQIGNKVIGGYHRMINREEYVEGAFDKEIKQLKNLIEEEDYEKLYNVLLGQSEFMYSGDYHETKDQQLPHQFVSLDFYDFLEEYWENYDNAAEAVQNWIYYGTKKDFEDLPDPHTEYT